MKKLFVLMLAAVLTLSLVACGNSSSGSQASAANNDTQPAAPIASETVPMAKPSTDGPVVKYKSYEHQKSENEYCTVFLRFRENSQYVAEVTINMVIPAGSSEYESFLNDNKDLEAKLKDGTVDPALVEFEFSESADKMTMLTKFYKLDQGYPEHVQMCAESTDLPVDGEYMLLSSCEQFLLGCGFVLVDQR